MSYCRFTEGDVYAYERWQDKPRYCAFCGVRMEEE